MSNVEISNNRDLGQFFERVSFLKYLPVSFGLLFVLTAVGVVLGWRQHPSVRLMVLLMLVYVLAMSLFFFNSRFRMPLLPGYFVIAGLGLTTLVSELRMRRRPWAAMMAGVGAAALTFSPLAPLPAGASPTWLTSKGLYHYSVGHYAAARDYHRSALALNDTFPEVNLNLGTAFLRLGETDSARYYFEREISLHPKREKAYINLASLALVEGKIDTAVCLVQKALALRPFDLTANRLLVRAVAAGDVGPDSLVRLLTSILEETGDNIYLLNEMAIIVAGRNDMALATTLLQRAIASEPPDIETDDRAFRPDFPNSRPRWRLQRAISHYQLGFVSGRQGQPEQALYHSRAAVACDSNLVEAYVNLVSAYRALGQTGLADSVMRAIERRFPDHPLLRQLRRRTLP